MITEEPKENSIERIMVVSAAIVNVEAKRLFVQRRSGDAPSYPWHWCTPGGKVKPQEDPFRALRRELHEEHAVHLMESARWNVQIVYRHELPPLATGTRIIVNCFRVNSSLVTGQYCAGDKVAGFDWVTANELEALTLTPADDANRGKLMALLR